MLRKKGCVPRRNIGIYTAVAKKGCVQACQERGWHPQEGGFCGPAEQEWCVCLQ